MTTTTTTAIRSPTPPRTGRSRPSTRPCGPAEATGPSSTTSSHRSAASSSRPSTCSPDSASSTSPPAPAPRRSRPHAAGAEVIATDLTPELLDVGRAAAAAEGLELTWQTADAEALPYDDAEFDVVMSSHRRDVRAAPPAGRRRARPGQPAGRHDRRAELDAGGLHRAAVRHHEAVRAAASSGSLAGPAVGSGRPRTRLCSATGSPTWSPTSRRCGSTASPPGRSSATSSRRTTARRSRCTASSPTTPPRSTPWTPTSPRWATGSSPTASWPGSTCS